MVEWSQQLRSVTSAWLGAVGRSVQNRLCTSGCKSEKIFGVISPPRDLLLSNELIVVCRDNDTEVLSRKLSMLSRDKKNGVQDAFPSKIELKMLLREHRGRYALA